MGKGPYYRKLKKVALDREKWKYRLVIRPIYRLKKKIGLFQSFLRVMIVFGMYYGFDFRHNRPGSCRENIEKKNNILNLTPPHEAIGNASSSSGEYLCAAPLDKSTITTKRL